MSGAWRVAAAGLLALWLLAGAAEARQWSWLGVRIRDLSEQEMDELSKRHGLREGFGVLIVEVIEGTPAERGGLRSGDVVVAFGERPVTETRLLQRLVGATSPAEEARLTVLREDGRRELRFRLVTMPRPMVAERIAAEFGFLLAEVETGPGRAGQAAPRVAAVVGGSAAERGGLAVGDLVVAINDRAVLTREAAAEALVDTAPAVRLRLAVRRGAQRLSLTLTLRAR